jgi:predicted PhzF superfamily epimerase YddE/YHI9
VPDLYVLRVFVNEDGEWGNRLGVFVDGGGIAAEERQRIAAELDFSEAVFVEDRASGRMRIHTPQVELPFAGHPTVGTAWLLAKRGEAVETLRPPAGEVAVWTADGVTWAEADPEWTPPFEYRQLESPAAVRRLTAPHDGHANVYAWAWIDEAAGTVHARSFVPQAGIAEDEATGSAALTLAGKLERPIAIHQGRGSVLFASPTTMTAPRSVATSRSTRCVATDRRAGGCAAYRAANLGLDVSSPTKPERLARRRSRAARRCGPESRTRIQ